MIWRRRKIAQSWRYTEGVFVPKEERSENMDRFQTISFLSMEIFFSVVAKKLSNFLLKNNFIDMSVEERHTRCPRPGSDQPRSGRPVKGVCCETQNTR